MTTTTQRLGIESLMHSLRLLKRKGLVRAGEFTLPEAHSIGVLVAKTLRMTTMENFREIGEYIREHFMGCRFVGISSDNEVFVEFENDDLDIHVGTAQRLRELFPYITKVTTVVKPSLAQVKQMVDELNTFIEGPQPEPKPPLLGIGEF
jgi:hypothetical protein